MNIIRFFIQKLYYFNVFKNAKIGNNVILSKNGTILRPHELEIGNNVFISKNFYISPWQMKIGSNVLIGPNFVAECDDHCFNTIGRTIFSDRLNRIKKRIIINDDVWIGCNVTLLKGVEIGEGCVIGAGSVVNRSIPPYTISCGVPCVPKKMRFTINELYDHLDHIQSSVKIDDCISTWNRLWKNS